LFVYSLEWPQIIAVVHIAEQTCKLVHKLVNLVVESASHSHQAAPHLVLPLLNNFKILDVASASFTSHFLDALKVLHLMLVALVNIQQLFGADQALKAHVSFFLVGVENCRSLVGVTQHFDTLVQISNNILAIHHASLVLLCTFSYIISGLLFLEASHEVVCIIINDNPIHCRALIIIWLNQ
jgi:hypothetical protein